MGFNWSDKSAWDNSTPATIVSGWADENSKSKRSDVDIATETGPIRFDFKELGDEESLTGSLCCRKLHGTT